MSVKIKAKAVGSESRSNGIVVSFGMEWYESLRKKDFTAIIRKRVPNGKKLRWLYFHINAPKSAICARAEILSVESLDLPKVLNMTKSLSLSKNKIKAYIEKDTRVGCYILGTIQFPLREVATNEIKMHMIYFPPQSFFHLSQDGKRILDQVCGFPEISSSAPRSNT